MNIPRLIGHVGVLIFVGFVTFAIWKEGGVPSGKNAWIALTMIFGAVASCFHFVPVTPNKESLIGLWIEAKKSKLRQEIKNG